MKLLTFSLSSLTLTEINTGRTIMQVRKSKEQGDEKSRRKVQLKRKSSKQKKKKK